MASAGGESDPERLVAGARLAAALDLIEKAREIALFDPIVVATDSPLWAGEFKAHGVEVDLDKGEFHFGRRLLELVRCYKAGKALYIGAGSAPLLPSSTLVNVARRLSEENGLLITNNLFSCDWVGFSPADALERIILPDTDNDLAWRLNDEAGLRAQVLPTSTATVFDIDTPAELSVLKLYPGLKGRLARYLHEVELDTSRVEAVIKRIRDEDAFVFAAGRVPSYAWIRLEKEGACRTRVLSEERGMRSSGRQKRGEVRSLLGCLVESLGPEGFFRRLAEMADAAIIDTRVLMAHWGVWPSPAERFSSDLFHPEGVSYDLLRRFTAAARDASIPVLLGGHSLVCGGIMALVDMAGPRQ